MTPATTVGEVRDVVAGWRHAGETVGFVPTMGFLHEGHLSLVRLARERARRVVVSIFVNPTQFGPAEDLDRYPRDEDRDRRALEAEDVDLLFLPTRSTMYPDGHSTSIEVTGVSAGLCGDRRPGHFRGVATVVAKLLNIVQPDLAVFGEKDRQQLAVIRRLVRDLDLPVKIVGGPIVRESDGLALSSRNTFLSATERSNARALSAALFRARDRIAAGDVDLEQVRAEATAMLAAADGLEIDYLELVDGDSMRPLSGALAVLDPQPRSIVVAAAVLAGRTRLIDNVEVRFAE